MIVVVEKYVVCSYLGAYDQPSATQVIRPWFYSIKSSLRDPSLWSRPCFVRIRTAFTFANSFILIAPQKKNRIPVPHRFQVGELRKHQLLETRVRCYALRHERLTSRTVEECKRAATAAAATAATGLSPMNGPTPSMNNLDISRAGSTSEELAANQPEQVSFQSHSMRLQHPDDEIGGNLLLVTPQVGMVPCLESADFDLLPFISLPVSSELCNEDRRFCGRRAPST